MTAIVARTELKHLLRDGRLRWSAAAVALLLVASLAFSWHGQRALENERAEAREQNRRQWLEQGARNPHSAAHFGVHAFKPPMPLAFLDPGLERWVGSSIWLEAHYQNPARHRPAEDATAAQRFGELSPARLAQILGPLLVILMGFGAFAAERESGTLRQLLSLGIAPRRLLAGKALGVAAALGLLLVPAALGALGALVLAGGELADATGRLGVSALAHVLYLAAFLGLALAVSARAKSAKTAFVALTGFWLWNVFLVPRAIGDLGDRLYPSPTGQEYWDAVRADLDLGIDGHNPADARGQKLQAEVLARYGVSRVEDLPINFAGISLQAGEEYSNTVHDKHQGRLWQSWDRQERLYELTAWIAPIHAIRLLSMGLAGTDLAHQRHFADAAESYRRQINRQLNDDLTHNSRTGDFYYFADRALWEQVPEFRYTPPGLAWALAQHRASLAVLLLWALGGTLAALAATRRLRPL